MTAQYWYFAAKDRRLRYNDGRKARVGVTHTVDRPIRLCKNGLHASERALDALKLGAGPVAFRVELSGDTDKGSDKIAARSRKYVAGGIDVTDTLAEFACCCAEAALLIAEHDDPRSWGAIEATRAYMRGEIEIGVLLDARNAAAAAADAAYAAANATAYATAAAANAATAAAATAYAAYAAAAAATAANAYAAYAAANAAAAATADAAYAAANAANAAAATADAATAYAAANAATRNEANALLEQMLMERINP
jgi:hypothetical protein